MGAVCKFNYISERDMDLLFLEEFIVSKEFLNIFTSKINIYNASVVEVEHSKTDTYGESDITVVIKVDGKRHGLLIENKINADAMPNQYGRYIVRGKKGKACGEYESFDVFIVAPKKYLEKNVEAQKYEYKISYETCMEYFEKNSDERKYFKSKQIKKAIEKQELGYQIIANVYVTEFWNKYLQYHSEKYYKLPIISKNGVKPSNSSWIYFHSFIANVNIVHKANKGCIDLEFPNLAEKFGKFDCVLRQILSVDAIEVSILRASKSVVVRIKVPKLDFTESFEEQVGNVEKCFKKIEEMFEISKVLDRENFLFLVRKE